jgi:tryptophan 2,3-dioxygenase
MPHRIKQQVRTAIDTPELRRAIRIMDNIHEAMELLTQISPPVLEALRDALKEMGGG